jgi:hypothetical protein
MGRACPKRNHPYFAFITCSYSLVCLGLDSPAGLRCGNGTKSGGMVDYSVPHVQAAESGSVNCQRDAILALAEVIDIRKEDMHVIYIESCLQVALSLFKGDHGDDVMPAALYLVATIFRAGPSKSSLGRKLVKGGGDKLLLKFLALPNAVRNESLYVILAIDLGGSDLAAVKDAIVTESSSQSLADLYGDYPPYTVDDNTVIRPVDLSKTYQHIYGRMPEFWTSTNMGKYFT